MENKKNKTKNKTRFQPGLYKTLTWHFIKNTLTGKKRFPLVLMLEPTHRCNLACMGCDRIRTAAEGDLPVSACLEAARECGAPVVAITGGEPMIYKYLQPLVKGLLSEGKYIYLCTNGVLAQEFIESFTPHPALTLNFHLDGLDTTHDKITGLPGSFNKAVESIRKAKAKGFRVSTNTTVYKASDPGELEGLFDLLYSSSVDGMLISPAFAYQSVEDNIFFNRGEINEKFTRMSGFLKKYPLINTPTYMDFLCGRRQMRCTPWGNPTYNPLGWKSPCYLVTDSYFPSYARMMKETNWSLYEDGKDPRCANCMVHGGYETTVMRMAFTNPLEGLRLAFWNFGSNNKKR
ncbi:MAG: adenosyl-hopene transferase HpnH [Nitrospiraceae bacterium]|nr:adenosyl-hopene transferase HpnH [Nitrospiraceae bacterium]